MVAMTIAVILNDGVIVKSLDVDIRLRITSIQPGILIVRLAHKDRGGKQYDQFEI